MKPFFSILMINYKGLKHLKECLPSLKNQTFKDFEIIFVDNDSNDQSVAWVQNFLDQNKISGKTMNSGANHGFAGGNNFGLPHCHGEWIFFLNNDTWLPPDTFQNLVNGIQAHPNGRVFGPQMVQLAHPELVDSAGDTLYTSGPSFQSYGESILLPQFQGDYNITSVCAGAAIYHSSVLSEIGWFDEDFWLIFEDVDLSLRAQNAGYQIMMLSKAKIHHKGSASIGKTSNMALYYGTRNIHWVRIKNYPTSTLIKYALYVGFCNLFAIKGAFIRGQGFLWFKAKCDALKMYPTMWKKRQTTRNHQSLNGHEFEKLLRKGWFVERVFHHARGGDKKKT